MKHDKTAVMQLFLATAAAAARIENGCGLGQSPTIGGGAV
jgi:hypothetical protein